MRDDVGARVAILGMASLQPRSVRVRRARFKRGNTSGLGASVEADCRAICPPPPPWHPVCGGISNLRVWKCSVEGGVRRDFPRLKGQLHLISILQDLPFPCFRVLCGYQPLWIFLQTEASRKYVVRPFNPPWLAAQRSTANQAPTLLGEVRFPRLSPV